MLLAFYFYVENMERNKKLEEEQEEENEENWERYIKKNKNLKI